MEFPLLSLMTFLPTLGAALLLAIRGEQAHVDRNCRYGALYTSLAVFALSLFMLVKFDGSSADFQFEEKAGWLSSLAINYHMGVDGISMFFVLLSAFLTPVCILASWTSITKRVREYMIAFLLLETLMIGTFCALDAVLFYVFFEGVLIPMFVIIGVWGGTRRIYSAFKLFLYTLLGSVLMLIALLVLYSQTGTTDIAAWADHPVARDLQMWLWLAFFASFAVKMPMWPVHTWLPDAHVEAPTAGSVILAGVLLKMGGYGFLRFSLPIFPEASAYFADMVFWLSVVAIIYTSLVALVQEDMKKLIAYSSVAHMGFVTLGIFTGTVQGVEGAMFQMLSHGLISGALFLCVGVVYDRLHTREISRYGGIVKNMPRYATLFMVFMLGSVGLPGTSGFAGEFLTPADKSRCGGNGRYQQDRDRIAGAHRPYGDHSRRISWHGARSHRPLSRKSDRPISGRAARRSACRQSARRCRPMNMVWNWNWNDLAVLAPEIFLALAGMGLLIKGAFCGDKATLMIGRASVAVFILAALLLVQLDWRGGPVLNGMFTLDSFAGFMKCLILTGLAASTLLSLRSLERDDIARPEYYVLTIFAGLGMMMMVSASSMLSLYVALELQSLSIYVLAAIRRDHAASSEAGLKYFVLGALASGMLLFGISLLYGFTGSLDFTAIAAAMKNAGSHTMPMIVGLVFILSGIAFKLSAVPFHMWTPDVYEGAPTPVTALMAIVPKVAAIAMLIRVLYQPFGAIASEWQQIVWFLAAASMLWSAFAALAQTNIKRLMAYSSIGNVGYALLGVAAGTAAGVGSVAVYMAIYLAMTAGVFAVILSMRRNGVEVVGISDLAGLSRTRPWLAYPLAIMMFSMSGIPPLAGFFGKLVVFQAALASGLYVLAVIGVLSSVVAAYYYLKIVKVMLFDEATASFDLDTSWGRRIVLGASVAFVLVFIGCGDTLIEAGRNTALSFFPS